MFSGFCVFSRSSRHQKPLLTVVVGCGADHAIPRRDGTLRTFFFRLTLRAGALKDLHVDQSSIPLKNPQRGNAHPPRQPLIIAKACTDGTLPSLSVPLPVQHENAVVLLPEVRPPPLGPDKPHTSASLLPSGVRSNIERRMSSLDLRRGFDRSHPMNIATPVVAKSSRTRTDFLLIALTAENMSSGRPLLHWLNW